MKDDKNYQNVLKAKRIEILLEAEKIAEKINMNSQKLTEESKKATSEDSMVA